MKVLILFVLLGLMPAKMKGKDLIKRRFIIQGQGIPAQVLYKFPRGPEDKHLAIMDHIGQDIIRRIAPIRDKDLFLPGITGSLAAEQLAECTFFTHLMYRLKRSFQKTIVQDVIQAVQKEELPH